MSASFGLRHYTIAASLFLALFAGNLFLWASPVVGAGLLIFFFLFFGCLVGGRLRPQADTLERIVWGASALVAIFSLYGAGAYYLDLLNQTTVAVGVMLTPVVLFFVCKSHITLAWPTTWGRPSFGRILSIAVLTTSAITLLLNHQITSPVRSPWLMIPPIFFLAIFLIAWMTNAKPNKWMIALFFFLTISVALLAYPLGYGFDGFIHKATEQHIFEFGTITPKPLYYVGQYALVIFAAHGFSIPVSLADSLLVPLLASLLLPLAAYFGFRAWLGKPRAATASLALFLVPLSSFIATTPQGLANMWTLLVVFASLPLLGGHRAGEVRAVHEPPLRQSFLLPLIFAAAALATHPLAGIPAVIYLIILFLSRHASRATLIATSIAAAVALPAIFIVNAAISHLPITLSLKDLANTSFTELFQLSLFAQNHFHPFLDAAYLFGWNRMVMMIVIVVAGCILLRRAKLGGSRDSRLSGSWLLLPSLILMINFFLLSTVLHFDFLIDYERQNYAIRAFDTAQFFLLPILGLAVSAFFANLEHKPFAIRFGASALTAIILTSALYATYPRHDNYEISRGFNVGQSDFSTVHYIHDQNATVDYIVLANQAVASAAVQEYGFLQYFHDDVFYYPIPTGGAMYQSYLAMVNSGPTKQRAIEAMDLAGVNKAYFVVNDYWFNAEKLIENAKRETTDWTAIDNGATYVFVYER